MRNKIKEGLEWYKEDYVNIEFAINYMVHIFRFSKVFNMYSFLIGVTVGVAIVSIISYIID